ncbi:MAG TPA: hypothetical protein PKA27_15440 [Fimbriimonadaceae bacterium]|nr:hypothetical protein [Fimbriimonadaceae bacterium]
MAFRGMMTSAALLAMAAVVGAQMTPELSTNRAKALRELQSQYPGVKAMFEGGSISRIYGVPFGYGETPKDAAREFVTNFGALVPTGSAELEYEGELEVMGGRFSIVYFKEVADGYPVEGRGIAVLVLNQPNHPVVLVSNRSEPVTAALQAPSLTGQQAIGMVEQLRPWLNEYGQPALCVYPTETSMRLAWAFTADNGVLSHPERYTAFVDAKTGAVLDWRNEIHHVDVSGNVTGYATPGLLPDQANNAPALTPLAGLLVQIAGGNSAYTDANGNYTVPNAGSGQVTVNATLTGRWVRAVNNAGANHTLSQIITPPGPANFLFNPTPQSLITAQVNAFIHTERVHNFAKQYVPTYPGIDIQMPANVNLANTCNAFYNGSSINFYQAGGGCPNTAYSTVVYHEYGHHLVGAAGTAQGAYGEGAGDTTAALLADSPSLGMDFLGVGAGPLRSCYNSITYPNNLAIHTAGQVLSGSFWLTHDALIARYGNRAQSLEIIRPLFLSSVLLRPAGISPQVTIDVLTLDDTDGNIYNGTPHYPQIRQGFNAKGLTAPDLEFLSIRALQIPGEFVQYEYNDVLIPMTAQFQDVTGTLNPASPKVVSRVNGGAWTSLPMDEIQDPGIYFGYIEQPGCGDVVEYYFEATDMNGNVERFPDAGPAAPLTVIVGRSLQNVFTDSFESALSWTVSNTSLTSGAWVRGNPNGTNLNGVPAQPENDSGDTGTLCMFTAQGAAGGAVGDADVDGGPTRVVSPAFSLAGGNGVIEYSRWYFNDDGDDAFSVEISNDGGATWVTVEGVTYTAANANNQWKRVKFLASRFVTPSSNMRLRFSATDNPNNSITEAAIDNVVINKVICD